MATLDEISVVIQVQLGKLREQLRQAESLVASSAKKMGQGTGGSAAGAGAVTASLFGSGSGSRLFTLFGKAVLWTQALKVGLDGVAGVAQLFRGEIEKGLDSLANAANTLTFGVYGALERTVASLFTNLDQLESRLARVGERNRELSGQLTGARTRQGLEAKLATLSATDTASLIRARLAESELGITALIAQMQASGARRSDIARAVAAQRRINQYHATSGLGHLTPAGLDSVLGALGTTASGGGDGGVPARLNFARQQILVAQIRNASFAELPSLLTLEHLRAYESIRAIERNSRGVPR